jgi:hypothetical protein
MSVEKVVVDSLDEDSKTDDERGMVTPWRTWIVGDSGALSTLLLI